VPSPRKLPAVPVLPPRLGLCPNRSANKRPRISYPYPAPPVISPSKPVRPPQLPSNEEFGKLVDRDSQLLETMGWEEFVRHRRSRGDFANLDSLRHPAKPLLQDLKHIGAPVQFSTPPWTPAQVQSALRQGPHKSAEEFADFLREELSVYIQKTFWTVIPFSKARYLKNLRLSPLGVIPQRDRRPRIIVNLSAHGVNDDTVPLAPKEAMQFGGTLQRIINDIVRANPAYGPVYLMKVDIADGYYRVWVRAEDIPKLGVSIPALTGGEPLVAFPLSLPMGWVSSPPYFCAASETAADLANEKAMRNVQPPAHRLETTANTLPSAPLGDVNTGSTAAAVPVPVQDNPMLVRDHSTRRKLGRFDIFVDDYIGAMQGGPKRKLQLTRILLQSIDEIFRPLDADDSPFRQEPSSVKKMKKGDAAWETRKLILGWIIDTILMTLELPDHRRARLHEILHSIPRSQKRTSVKVWHSILGELRSMSLALPGSRGLFSELQDALRHKTQNRLRLSRGVHDALDDFRWLADNIANRPTRLAELVATPPAVHGTSDASGQGMGGVAFPPSPEFRSPEAVESDDAPILWRARFPPDITSNLVSWSNPTGRITNSDLELAGTIIEHDAIVQNWDVRERTVRVCTDNTPAEAWQQKGSVTSTAAPAYLLRIQAIHQRYHRYRPDTAYLPGPLNVMSDDCSRLWHLSDTQLLAHFNATYPQTRSWRLWHPTPEMLSAVTSALRRTRSAPESFLVAPTRLTRPFASGRPSAKNSASIPGYKARPSAPTRSSSSKSLPIGIAPVLSLPKVNRSDLEQWRTPSAAWAKRLRHWGPRIRASTHKASPISASNAN
jgi:hypothetical protein